MDNYAEHPDETRPTRPAAERGSMPAWRERLRVHGPALLLLSVLTAAAFPWWFLPGGPVYDDLTRLNAPQRMLLAWSLRHLQIPLWNPFSFGGQPFLAAGQSGPLYPPNWLYALLPIVTALKWSYALHTLFAAVGCYLVSWHVTRRRLAGVISGVCFPASGFMLGHQVHTQMFDAISWLPLLLYLLLRVFDDGRWRFALGLALCGALEVYAGHPQMSFFACLFLGLTALGLLLLGRWPHRLRALGRTLVAAALAACLSAAQWLPTVALVLYSDREQVPSWFLLSLSMPLKGLLQLLTPFSAGGGYAGPFTVQQFASEYGFQTFWELTSYAGITALVLAATAALCQLRRHPLVPILTVAGILFGAFSVGYHGIFPTLLTNLPGFDLFRVPARYIGLTDLSISLLAGIGMAALADAAARGSRRPVVTAAVCALVCVILLSVDWAFGVLHRHPWSATLMPAVLVCLVPAAAWMVRRSRQTWTSAALAAAVVFDVTTQAAWWSPFIAGADPSYTSTDPVTSYVASHIHNPAAPLQRIASFPDAPLAFDEAAGFQIPSLDGYDSLVPQWYVNTVNLTWRTNTLLSEPRSLLDAYDVKYILTEDDDTPDWATFPGGITSYRHTFAKVPAGTYALRLTLTPNGAFAEGTQPLLTVTLTSGAHHWTELLQGAPNDTFLIPLPADWPTGQSTTVTARCESWSTPVWLGSLTWVSAASGMSRPYHVDALLSPEPLQQVFSDGTTTVWENPDATQSAWVTQNTDDPLAAPDGSASPVSNRENGQIWLTRAPRAGTLVLSQTYDPGWRAYVDGKPVPVTRVGSLYGNVLTGVSVPAGTHRVVLVYRPRSFEVGAALSGGTALLLLGLWVIRSRRRVGRA
ncbi:MAG: YfhO family protein [Alicyclobacillus sp.]|nr:YfhO family protein [Alicyclobacillus sp.]